ncbi:MAG: right-handed parallel beta-helix repeat-containing protein, partial [Thermoleophilia bacterium]
MGVKPMEIGTGASLTIGAGTVVKPKTPSIGINVKGSLYADGTVFTSYHDDSHGGDTNGDAAGTGPAPGDWRRIDFISTGSSGCLRSVSVLYAGGDYSEAAVETSSPIELSNSTISLSAGAGIHVRTGSSSISDNTVSSNNGEGINAEVPMSLFAGNIFYDNAGVAARIPAATGTGVYSNTFSGNGNNALFLSGDVTVDSTWPANSGPYVLGTTRVYDGVTLDVADSVIKFSAGFDVQTGSHTDTNKDLTVSGSLISNGAVFTSWFDDSAGGDTNNDGDLTGPLPGDWARVYVKGGSLSDSVFSYGGSGIAGAYGELVLETAALQRSEVSNSSTRGVYISSTGSSVTASLIADNGEEGLFATSEVVGLSGNIFSGNAGSAVEMPATTGFGVYDNSFSNNGHDAVYLYGDITADSSWPASSSPYVLLGDEGYYGDEVAEIHPGVTLDINPGSVVKFFSGANGGNTDQVLLVNGSLNAQGMIFTSYFDDNVGGDTDRVEGAQANPGDWYDIRFGSGSSGSIISSVIAYGGGRIVGPRSQIGIYGASPLLNGNYIFGSAGDGVYIDDGNPSISVCSFQFNYGDGLNSQVGLSTVAGNEFVSNGGYAAVLDSIIGTGVYDNTYAENGRNAMTLTGDVTQNTTWSVSNSPYVIDKQNGITVAPGATLNIGSASEPNTVVKFAASVDNEWNHTNVDNSLNVAGILKADHAVFTSYFDDANGGDTDNLGNIVAPEAGDWFFISFGAQSSASTLTNSAVFYGGGPGYGSTGFGQILISNSSPTITQTAVSYSQSSGIYVASGSPNIHYNDIYANNEDGYALANKTGILDVSLNYWNQHQDPAAHGPNRVEGAEAIPWLDACETAFCRSAVDRGTDTWAAMAGEPVNAATGAFIYSQNDIGILTRGIPLSFSRTYNSNDDSHGPLGYGWSHNWQVSVSPHQNGDVSVLRGDGRADRFILTLAGDYTPPKGRHDTLTKNPDGTYRLTTPGQITYNFDAANRLASVVGRNGQATTLAYDSNHRLTTITGPEGRTLALSYNSAGQLTAATDPAGNSVTFTYTSGGDLQTATDMNGGVTTYAYENHRITAVTDPNGHSFVNNVYDPGSGKVVSQTDAEANLVLFGYDTNNRVTTVTTRIDPIDPSRDQVVRYYHDAQNRLLREVDSYGNEITYTYDAAGNQDSVTDPNGVTNKRFFDMAGNVTDLYLAYGRPEQQHTHYTFNSSNNPTSATNARGQTANLSYDATGNMLVQKDYPSVTSYDGTVSSYTQSFTYNADGLLATVSDRNGDVTAFTYDSNGYPDIVNTNVNRPAAEQATVDFDFDQTGKRVGLVDMNGRSTAYEYDAGGNLRFIRTSVTDPDSGQPQEIVVEYRYDGNGNITEVIDPEGKSSLYAYTAMDKLSVATDALGNTVEYTYDAAYNRTGVKDRNGNWTSLDYDKNNRLVKFTEPGANETAFGYDATGNLTSVTDPLDRTVTYAYDPLRRVVSMVEPDEGGATRTTTYSYDRGDNLVSVTDPGGNTYSRTYDEISRLKTISDPLGNSASYRYDGVGNIAKTKDPRGHETVFSYNASDMLMSVADPLGGLTQYDYDDNGNRIKQVDVEGNTTYYAYDELDRIINEKVDDGSGGFMLDSSYRYDRSGNLVKDINGEGVIDFYYDDDYNLTGIIDRDGALTFYTFDANQNLTSATDGLGRTAAFSYDSRGLLTRSVDVFGGEENYSYDAAANLVQQDDVIAGQTITKTYSYTPRNQLSNFTRGSESATYSYDAVGNLVSKSYASGIDTTYAYDAASRLTGLETRLGAQVLDSYSQVYDPSGNITAMTQLGQGTSTYAYDALDRLTAENISGYGNITYSYDGVGNRTAVNNPATGLTTYQYNPANQLVSLTGSQGTTSFSYDAAGALVSGASGTGISSYTYDGLDQLSAVSTPSGDASYTYDALGRRVTRTEGSYTERHHMAGFSDYTDYITDGSGALIGATLRGADGLIAYIACWPGGQFVGYQHFNPHGDSTLISDAAGNPLYSSRYDSFGNAVSGGGLTFGYSAKWLRLTEDLTGTVQMGVRDYDPATGRFTSVDPLRGTPFDPQQRNRYTFTSNNPLVRYDLSGLAWCEPTFADEMEDMAGW